MTTYPQVVQGAQICPIKLLLAGGGPAGRVHAPDRGRVRTGRQGAAESGPAAIPGGGWDARDLRAPGGAGGRIQAEISSENLRHVPLWSWLDIVINADSPPRHARRR